MRELATDYKIFEFFFRKYKGRASHFKFDLKFDNNMDAKKFKAVYFNESNTSAVVPRMWIIDMKNGYRCYWPKNGNPSKLAKKNSKPDDSWPLYKCEIVDSSGMYCYSSACFKQIHATIY